MEGTEPKLVRESTHARKHTRAKVSSHTSHTICVTFDKNTQRMTHEPTAVIRLSGKIRVLISNFSLNREAH